jgi:hypothetical protein
VIKTIFTMAIVAIILNAVYHAGMTTWRYFQVRDQAQQLILFGANVPTSDLEYQIAQIAEEFEVPIERQDIVVTRQGARTIAEAYYTMPVEVFPRIFYPVDLSFMVEAFAVEVAR